MKSGTDINVDPKSINLNNFGHHQVKILPGLVALPETLCLFPVYRVRAVYEHQTVFFFQHADRTES